MHNILESTKTIRIDQIIRELDHAKSERATLAKELERVSTESTISYDIPCSSDNHRQNETIQVEAIPAVIVERLQKDIQERQNYIFELIKYLEEFYTEGF